MTENNLEVNEREEIIKKRRKRLKISIAAVLLVIVILYVFVWPHLETPYAIYDLNKNIDLPFKFDTPMSEYDIDEEWIEYDDKNSIVVEMYDGERYGFFRGVDDCSTYKFTNYHTNSPKTSLFGFKVGDSMDKADRQLRKHGYRCKSIESRCVIYQKGRIFIWIYTQLKEDGSKKKENINNKLITGYAVKLECTDEQKKYEY